MGKPDFLCIGTQKSGTTWLYENLARHQEVWTPPIKEFHYFNRLCMNEQLLGDWGMPVPKRDPMYWNAIKAGKLNDLRWLRNYYEQGLPKAWYLNLFDEKYTKGRRCGDMTPGYSTLEERGVSYVRDVVGADTPIILTIRHPIHRSWSAAKMMFRHYGLEVESDANADKLIKLLQSPKIMLCSDYTRIIPTWRKFFGNVHVLTYDELCQDPHGYLGRISSILNIENKWDKPTIESRVWSDAKKIVIPAAIQEHLKNQYCEEIQATKKLVNDAYVDQWEKDI